MKKVMITGASDGIGKCIALKLAKEGYDLVLCGLDEDKLVEVAEQCGENVQTLAFDINDKQARETALSQVEGLDVLINNAGIWHKVGDLETIDDELIERVINTNLTSHILITKALLPQLRNKEGASIINVISKSGVAVKPGQSVYSASKWGMRGFTDVLREDTAEDAIKIGAVYQSGTRTNLFAKAGEDFPVETFTEPDDLADVVAFMLSRPKKLWVDEIRIDK